MWSFYIRRRELKTAGQFRHSQMGDKSFQSRLTTGIVVGAALGLAASMIPTLYFINENYRIFSDLAYQQAPELLNDLERERVWIHILFAGSFVGCLFYFSYMIWRISHRVAAPLEILKMHLKSLCRGNWKASGIRVRQDDEFQDLIETYNYFYYSFRQNVKRDIEFLKKLSVDQRNKDAYRAWRHLVEEKSNQLNISPFHDVTADRSRDSRHVS